MKSKVILLLSLGVALLLGATVGATFSQWNNSSSADNGIITSGDLDIALVGATEWQHTSPDVPGTPVAIDPATYLATPGDTFAVNQAFSTQISGENMRGRLTVSWSTAATVPAGVTAEYRLLDSANDPVGSPTPVPFGTPLGEDGVALGADTYTLEITLTYSGSKPDLMMPATQMLNFGEISMNLEQIRTGSGFN